MTVAPSFAEFVRDRDVVLVGPSGGYAGLRRGAEIDAFDVVVRLNWGCPVPEDQRADLGQRTDVLYKRMLTGALPEEADVAGWVADGIRWLVSSDQNLRNSQAQRFATLVRGRFPWMAIGNVRSEILDELKNGPLMGVMAIKHLLKQPLASLTVLNCDFYAGGYMAGYGGADYRKSRGRAEGKIAEAHDAEVQLRYLGKLQAGDARLRFDEKLQELVRGALRNQARQDVAAIIPARWESSRFPGKPLAEIAGRAMVLHVCDRVVQALGEATVATDDQRIALCVEEAGFKAVMTGEAATGTDRVAAAVAAAKIKAPIILNVQGDEPLVEPEDLFALIEGKRLNPKAVAYGVAPLAAGQAEDRSVVKAAVAGGRLIYASRAAVPATKDGQAAAWRATGLYAMSAEELTAFAQRGRGALEAVEDVEILRWLEMGYPVRTVEVQGGGPAVDLPEHINLIEQALKARA